MRGHGVLRRDAAGDLDGLGLAKTIGKRYPQIPVLLTSGYAKALSGQHRMPILRKPYQISALAEAVRSTLEARRNQS